MSTGGDAVARMLVSLRALGLPDPTPEYRFHPTRRWRWDYCWPEIRLAVEINGGTWAYKPSHTGAGARRDAEKANAGVMLGWTLLTYTTDMLGEAAEQIAAAYRLCAWRRVHPMAEAR